MLIADAQYSDIMVSQTLHTLAKSKTSTRSGKLCCINSNDKMLTAETLKELLKCKLDGQQCHWQSSLDADTAVANGVRGSFRAT
jgi:hypothetical protein